MDVSLKHRWPATKPRGGTTLKRLPGGEMCLPFDGVDVPFAGNPFEGLNATVTETQTGARHQVLHRARHQNLVCVGERSDARADVHRYAADIVADHFALPRMQPGADSDAKRLDFLRYRASAAYAARRPVEGGENAVARALHLIAAEAREV